MKKIIPLFVFTLLFALSAIAEDVVYLNNGNVVKGTVTSDDGTVVEIQTASGNKLQYKKVEVRKIDKASVAIVPETPKRAKYVDYETKDNGWWCAVELMGGGSVDANYNPNFYNIGFSFINGYRFNQWIRVGIGLGFRYYITTNNSYYTERGYYEGCNIAEPKMVISGENSIAPEYKGVSYKGSPWAIPLFIDIRGNFITNDTRQVVPYWAFDFGFSFSGKYLDGLVAVPAQGSEEPCDYDSSKAQEKLGDGIFFAPTIGVKIGTPRHTLLIGLTYMGQVLPRYGMNGGYYERNTDELMPTVGARFTSFMCGKIAYEF